MFQDAWIKFANATNKIIDQKRRQPGRGYVGDNYWAFATDTLKVITQEEYSREIAEAWSALYEGTRTRQGAELLLSEVSNFPPLAEGILGGSKKKKDDVKKPYKLKDGLGIAKTIIESLKDLLNLSERGKLFLNLYGEAIDIFKG